MINIDVKYDLDGIKDLCLITTAVHGGNHRYFIETNNQADIKVAGFNCT